MSMWTGASDELAQYLAQREVERQREFVNATTLQERDYRRKRDTIGDQRDAKQDALAADREKRIQEDADENRKERETNARFRRASTLHTTMQPGGVTGDGKTYDALNEFGLADDVVKKIALPVLKIARPSQPGANAGDLATVATERDVPVGPAYQSLGGTDAQQKARDAETRTQAAAAAAAERASEGEANRQSREQIAADAQASRQQIAALAASMKGQGGGMTPYQRMQYQNSLRDDYTRESKNFVAVAGAYRDLHATLSQASAAGDRAAIFQFMRQLDPTSVVRESEQATAENARGVPEHIRAVYNKLVNGEVLTPAQRKDFLATSGNIYQSQHQAQQRRIEEYTADAVAAGIDPKRVIRDYTVDGSAPAAEPGAPAPAPARPAPGASLGADWGKK